MQPAPQALASTITEKFITASPKQAAAALETLATHEVLQLISPLKAQTIIAVLNPMDPPKAAAVLRRLPLRQASYVLTRLSVPQAAKLMSLFSGPYRERISAVLEPAFLQLLSGASSYADDAVGRVMQTDFVAVRTEVKLAQLIERLKNLPRKKIPAICIITDKEGVLKGIIRPAELAFYSPDCVAGSVMSASAVLHPQDTLSKARDVFAKSESEALPVVNEQQICVGVLLRANLPTLPDKKSFWQKLTD